MRLWRKDGLSWADRIRRGEEPAQVFHDEHGNFIGEQYAVKLVDALPAMIRRARATGLNITSLLPVADGAWHPCGVRAGLSRD